MASFQTDSLRSSALLLFVVSVGCSLQAAPEPAASARHPQVIDLNTPRQFPAIASREQWQARAKDIRENILVSCGLWPMPEKTPLKARIFGKIERDGYSIEKVYLQPMPGFYLAGNLYRPLGHGKGPFPGILNPHGHWKEGRLADTKDGSAAARCINFARQGMVAFSYDMVGFNDTHFADAPTDKPHYDVHRSFGAAQSDQLWNISLMGLQTWDSIRALDFLESLPDVDKKHLACTGESGGGTQTFMLGAIDARLAVQAPIVMVSHTMQGGCSCENAPGLRVEYSNMEIAATPAPRPQLLVAATGDWTKATPTVEGPAIGHIYELLNAHDKFDFVRFDFGHNYNQTSREAVYAWFGKWLLRNSAPASLKESPYQKEPDNDLRVFPDGKLPDDALTREQFTESLKKLHRDQWQAILPRGKADLEKFKQVMLPAWRHTLQLEPQAGWFDLVQSAPKRVGEFERTLITNAHARAIGSLATLWAPVNFRTNPIPSKLVVLAHLNDSSAPTNNDSPGGLTLQLLQHHIAVVEMSYDSTDAPPNQFANFYTTYNRTQLQQRVGDLLRICSLGKDMRCQVILLGGGPAGLWSLLVAPAADAVVADANSLDVSDDQALLSPDFFFPGIRTIGVFEGAPLLAAPHPLLLHNTGKSFPTDGVRSGYKTADATKHLRIESDRLTDDSQLNWVLGL
jgi:hypothetical protein